mmetsp:Transcript_18892/g.52708  ORF Transcript_18892/g.52708 Transcript_18892/m.52708 type:complete len:230 (+) Transcript_18892:296-985(+)
MYRNAECCVVREEPWMEALTSTQTGFFLPCPRCSGAGRDVTINFFCIDCADPMGFCSKCTEDHTGHSCLQVRRSSYHDVIRVPDLARVTDVSGIQTYMINSSKVIFLKQRPQPRPSNTAITCECCRRQLQDAQYCSLRCKFECTGLVAPSSDDVIEKASGHPKGKRSQRPPRQRSPVLAPGTPSNSEPDMERTYSFDDAQSRPTLKLAACESFTSNSRRKKRPRRSPVE